MRPDSFPHSQDKEKEPESSTSETHLGYISDVEALNTTEPIGPRESQHVVDAMAYFYSMKLSYEI